MLGIPFTEYRLVSLSSFQRGKGSLQFPCLLRQQTTELSSPGAVGSFAVEIRLC